MGQGHRKFRNYTSNDHFTVTKHSTRCIVYRGPRAVPGWARRGQRAVVAPPEHTPAQSAVADKKYSKRYIFVVIGTLL